jgi:hypothetical protein
MFLSAKRRAMYRYLIAFFIGVCGTVALLANVPQGTGSIGAAHTIEMVGGLILFWMPFSSRGRTRPHWVRIALWMVAAILLGLSLMGFILLFAVARISPQMGHLLSYMRTVFEGMSLGILLLLVISGEFFSANSAKKGLRKAGGRQASL